MVKKSGKGLGRGLDAIFATEHIELVEEMCIRDRVVGLSTKRMTKYSRTIWKDRP